MSSKKDARRLSFYKLKTEGEFRWICRLSVGISLDHLGLKSAADFKTAAANDAYQTASVVDM